MNNESRRANMSFLGEIKRRKVLGSVVFGTAAALLPSRDRGAAGFGGPALVAASLLVSVPPTIAQDARPPMLSGVWSTTVTAIENPAWSIEELFACTCTSDAYERLAQLLNDPEYDRLSAAEILSEIRAVNRRSISELFTDFGREYVAAFDLADDPAIQCEPFGAFRSLLHADPVQIEQYEDRVVIRGEDMASDRVIYLDGRDHPADGQSTLTGHSIGWYEGSTLVVETVGVRANIAEDQLNIHNSNEASSVERYTVSDDGSRLHMSFTLDDPVMFREPLTLERTRLFTPEVQLQDLPCEAISGQP